MESSKVDWTKVNIRSVYRSLSPEGRAEHQRLAELDDQDMAFWQAEGDKIYAERMQAGLPRRAAIAALRRECNRQGLSDDEMIARSGLNAEALASMAGRDAKPTIETMEAYARALGKRLLIVLVDEENSDEG